jgi:hypothetical protein
MPDETFNVLFIFEDVASDVKALRWGEEVKKLAFKGRHIKVGQIWIIHDVNIPSPDVRANFDLVATTFQIQERQLEAFMHNYLDMFYDKRVAIDLIHKNTQNHSMFVVNQTKAVESPIDAIMIAPLEKGGPYFDAMHVPPFRCGNDRFWEESGCDWSEQVRLKKNFPDPEPPELLTRLQLSWKKRPGNNRREDEKAAKPNTDGMPRLVTNQPEADPRYDGRGPLTETSAVVQAASQAVDLPYWLEYRPRSGPFDVRDE